MLPTHHVAAANGVNPSTKAANAAGLKICLFFQANTYFEAIAITPARTSAIASLPDDIGEIIRNKIPPVMNADSLFITAPTIFENKKFATQHVTITIVAESTNVGPLYESTPKKPRRIAIAAIAKTAYIVKRYIAIPFKNRSI